ncbi:hypothetical protein IEZ30_00050 [Chromobacterium haemolyticum]|nr:hypothetical protein IEZ30_00050 [Chromobacterium haemolyticum]
MFKFGALEGELGKCLTESRTELIQAGARGSTIPQKTIHQPKFVSSLPQPAKDVVRGWFGKHATFNNDTDPIEALKLVRKAESDKVECAHATWRAVLGAYASEPISEAIQKFLEGQEEVTASTPETISASDRDFNCITKEDAELCVKISQGNSDFSSPSRIVPTLLAGVVAILRGDSEMAATHKDGLEKITNPLAKEFGKVIDGFGEYAKSRQVGKITVCRAKEFSSEKLDIPQSCQIFGIVKRVISGGYFVGVKGLFVDNSIIELTIDQAKFLFPSNGDVIGFPGVGGKGQQFFEGELGIWRVEHKPSDKSAQYVAVEHLSRVYDVIHVPHPSSDEDKIREWIQNLYQAKREKVYPLFALSDGLVLRIPGDPKEPARFDFDTLLEGYKNIEVTKLSDGLEIVPTPLPTLDVPFDCAPVSTCLKRLLKECVDAETIPKLSQAQIKAITGFAGEKETIAHRKTYQRAAAQLRNMEEARQLLWEISTDLLQLPEVKVVVESKKADILKEFHRQQEDLVNEISSLEKKKTQILQELEKLQQNARKETERAKKIAERQEVELVARIKKVFDQATADGIETLAQTALFKAILPSNAVQSDVITKVSEPSGSEAISVEQKVNPIIEASLPLNSAEELQRSISRVGRGSGLDPDMLASVIAAGRVSPVVGIVGRRSRKVISAIGDLIAGGTTCEVSVTGDMFSLSDLMRAPAIVRAVNGTEPSCLGDFLENRQKSGKTAVIELRGFNRIPPETVLPELTEIRLDGDMPSGISWVDRMGKPRFTEITMPVVFLVSFVLGKSTFPIHMSLAQDLPIVQVDAGWLDEDPPDLSYQMKTTLVTVNAWMELAPNIGEEADPVLNQEPKLQKASRLSLVAEALGLPTTVAKAIGILSFGIGRQLNVDIKERVGQDAPQMLEYVTAATGGEIGRLIEHIMQSEIGDPS